MQQLHPSGAAIAVNSSPALLQLFHSSSESCAQDVELHACRSALYSQASLGERRQVTAAFCPVLLCY